MNKNHLPKGTKISDWLNSLPNEAQDRINDLLVEASTDGPMNVEIPGLGIATIRIDECSEGLDRGGYVHYLQFHDVTYDCDWKSPAKLELESETDFNEWFFSGRCTQI